MEPNRFDEFTKTLATATSRRQALKTIIATSMAGILGLGGAGEALARKCKPKGHTCRVNSDCCGFLVCDSSTKTCSCIPGACNHNCPCPTGETCDNVGACCPSAQICLLTGQCCSTGEGCCDDLNCTNLQTDDNNCGSCGNKCSANETCFGGKCDCLAPYTQCGNTCVDTDTDPNNCGGCGVVCASGGTCNNGQCCVSCPYAPPNGQCCGSGTSVVCCNQSVCCDTSQGCSC